MVVVDATALWLKLRGEEKVYLHESELLPTGAKARVKQLRRKFVETKAQYDRGAYGRERDKWLEDRPGHKAQVDQAYSSAGDKYRVTLINVSGVEHLLHACAGLDRLQRFRVWGFWGSGFRIKGLGFRVLTHFTLSYKKRNTYG